MLLYHVPWSEAQLISQELRRHESKILHDLEIVSITVVPFVALMRSISSRLFIIGNIISLHKNTLHQCLLQYKRSLRLGLKLQRRALC